MRKQKSLKELILSHEDFPLIKNGLKPLLFISIKNKNYKFKAYQLQKINEDITFFAEPWFDKSINLVILNKKSLEKMRPKLNRLQKMNNFESVKEIVKLIQNRYKFRKKTQKFSMEEKINYSFIEGLCFGFPLPCIKEFIKEATSTNLRPDRIVYRLSKNVAFIGYPEYYKQCDAVLLRWHKELEKSRS